MAEYRCQFSTTEKYDIFHFDLPQTGAGLYHFFHEKLEDKGITLKEWNPMNGKIGEIIPNTEQLYTDEGIYVVVTDDDGGRRSNNSITER